MQTILNYLVGYGYPIVVGLIQVLIVLAIIWLINAVVTYFCTKKGINISEDMSETINEKIATVVRYVNQTIVDDMKKKNNGVLTNEEQVKVMETATNLITRILSEDEIESIAKKYNIPVDEALKMLTEVQVRESKLYE